MLIGQMWRVSPESGSAQRPVVFDNRRLLDDAFHRRRRRLAAALKKGLRVRIPEHQAIEDNGTDQVDEGYKLFPFLPGNYSHIAQF